MSDFNAIYDAGDVDGKIVNVVIEISEGSTLKIEYRRKLGTFELDRVEPKIFAKPCNYGFIPTTLDEDGDELDVLMVCHEPLPMGLVLPGRIIGILNFEDDGEMDHKVICVPADDRNNGDMIKSFDDLGERWKQQIEYHFSHYKDLKKPGTTVVQGFGSADDAVKIIKECQVRWNEQ